MMMVLPVTMTIALVMVLMIISSHNKPFHNNCRIKQIINGDSVERIDRKMAELSARRGARALADEKARLKAEERARIRHGNAEMRARILAQEKGRDAKSLDADTQQARRAVALARAEAKGAAPDSSEDDFSEDLIRQASRAANNLSPTAATERLGPEARAAHIASLVETGASVVGSSAPNTFAGVACWYSVHASRGGLPSWGGACGSTGVRLPRSSPWQRNSEKSRPADSR